VRKLFNTLAYICCAGFLIAAGFTHQGQVCEVILEMSQESVGALHRIIPQPSCLALPSQSPSLPSLVPPSLSQHTSALAPLPTATFANECLQHAALLQDSEAVAFLSLSQGLAGLAMAGKSVCAAMSTAGTFLHASR